MRGGLIDRRARKHQSQAISRVPLTDTMYVRCHVSGNVQIHRWPTGGRTSTVSLHIRP